jgi:prepilin signal peptidase PulO-like enzyme (type II secretory pathway)
VTTPTSVAPAPAPASTSTPSSLAGRFSEALPARWRVATAAALAFAPVALWRFGVDAEGLVGVLFFAVLAVLAVKDLEEQRIPNVIVLPATAGMLVAVAALQRERLLEAVVAALAAAAFLFVPSVIAKGGVGLGDVKLALLLGAALGRGVAAALLVGCLAASIFGVVLLVRHGSGARKTAVPFAPFLVLGALAAVALGAQHAL